MSLFDGRPIDDSPAPELPLDGPRALPLWTDEEARRLRKCRGFRLREAERLARRRFEIQKVSCSRDLEWPEIAAVQNLTREIAELLVP